MTESLDVFHASTGNLSSPRENSALDFSGLSAPVEISNCFVTREGLILNENMDLIENLHDEHIYWEGGAMSFHKDTITNSMNATSRLNHLREKVSQLKLSKFVAFNSNTAFVYLMHPFGWYAYGHLFDTLQRLYSLQTRAPGSRHLLVSDSRRVRDFGCHVNALGYDIKQLFYFPVGVELVRLERLMFSYSPATITQFTCESINWIRESYLKLLAHRSILIEPHVNNGYCLFLDRNNTARRSLLNKDEVISRITLAGIPVIVLNGSESFCEALYLYSNAKYIVGAHGAMFVNTIFAPEEATIVELCPSNRRVFNMLRMCKPCRRHTLSFWKADDSHNINPSPDTVLDLMNAFD
jgi:hypothetical protein